MKISEMAVSTTPSTDDVFPILEGNEFNKKMSFDTLRGWIKETAVDGQVAELKNDVINTASACSELITTQTGYTENYVKWDNGYVSPNTGFDCTTYTDISKYKYLLYTDTAGTGASPAFGTAFYTNKTVGGYISGVQSYGGRNTADYAYRVVKIPDNAVYARFTMFTIATSIPFEVRGFYNIDDIKNDIDDIKNDIDNIDAQIENNVYATCDLFDSFVIGGISVNGAATTDTTRARTYKALEIPENAYVYCDPSLEYKIVYYTSNNAYRDTFDSAVPAAFTSDPIDLIPGKYAKFLVRYKADPTQVFTDVSGLKDLINIKYKIASNDIKPLTNMYFSLMGDSISSLAGYVPEGNAVYYNGSNHGITDVSQMWWDVLCQITGMVRCVINAWSGSGVTQLTDAQHLNRVPMSDPSRCSNLGLSAMTPDVIIITGGTNDYTYAEQSSQEPLPWDGLTAPQDLTSFTQQYAIMIHRIQANYPDAIIVCCSTFFTMRGDDNGYTRTHTVGSNTYTQDDYDNAIKHVCGLMGVPYLEIRNIGFNQNNYYPKYAPDSATIPTHPNAAGHAIIGNAVAEKIVDFVKGYCDNIVH